MGNYEISAFKYDVQKFIKENGIDDGNGIIETDNGELARLLSAMGKNDISQLLNDVNMNGYIQREGNDFLNRHILNRAEALGVVIPATAKIEITNFDTRDARDVYSGNAFKGDMGISLKKSIDDAWVWMQNLADKDLSQKTVEEYCKERGLSPEETKKVLQLYYVNNVRVNVYKARVKDMRNLLSKDREQVERRVAQMNISDEEKMQIMSTKDFFDNYYKINLKVGNNTFNLLNLSENDKKVLAETYPDNPEFVNFITNLGYLKKDASTFASKEMLNDEINDAGKTSRWIAAPLLAILGTGVVKGAIESKKLKEGMNKAQRFVDFIHKNPEKGNDILNRCVAKLNKLSQNGARQLDNGALVGSDVIERYMRRIGMEGGEFIVDQAARYGRGLKWWVNPIKALKGSKGSALAGLIATIAALSADDCLGSVKDFFQDTNNFGIVVGGAFGVASIAGGLGSTIAVAPSLVNITKYRTAENVLRKFNLLPKMSKWGKVLNRGKWALLGIPLGLILTSSSSGSSWTSMGLTRLQFAINGNKLEEKNIITEEENTFKASNENMMAYEAYEGKWKGITFSPTGDWTIGAVGGATGVFMHSNQLIANTATVVQGCSETITASAYQLVGNVRRDGKLEKEKESFVASASDVEKEEVKKEKEEKLLADAA